MKCTQNSKLNPTGKKKPYWLLNLRVQTLGPVLGIRFIWNISFSPDSELTVLDVLLTAEELHLVDRPDSMEYSHELGEEIEQTKCSPRNPPLEWKIAIVWALWFCIPLQPFPTFESSAGTGDLG